jgi:hypothetical protein
MNIGGLLQSEGKRPPVKPVVKLEGTRESSSLNRLRRPGGGVEV